MKENLLKIAKLDYKKNIIYVKFGMLICVLGLLNFIIGFMFFPQLWDKTLSLSTVLVLLGIGIIIVFEEKFKRIRKVYM